MLRLVAAWQDFSSALFLGLLQADSFAALPQCYE
jgi:hypothetical protein